MAYPIMKCFIFARSLSHYEIEREAEGERESNENMNEKC